jgi:H+-translocating NAD(P) transhydrogenase subunit alpha
MKIAVLKEHTVNEHRVAIHPEIIKKYISLGFEVCIESGAGEQAHISNQEYIDSGAKISKVPLEIIADADIILKVQPSDFIKSKNEMSDFKLIRKDTIIIGLFSPHNNIDLFNKCADKNITTFSMELIPRISRAQTMDVLSSQTNIAGYKAIMEAANLFNGLFPMMMTAAGTIPPAKVLILGAGVAGLQAIATAKRLGATVYAFDVRPETKEQVQSLGATYIEVGSNESGSASGGYAKEMSEEYKRKQSQLLAEYVAKSDIVVTTALIPGKPAPKLISKEMVDSMKAGSVIVDLAAINGGNCELTETDKVVNYKNISIIGYGNLASRVAREASRLYSKNLYNFIELLVNKQEKVLTVNLEDEIIAGALVTYKGQVVHSMFKGDK